MTTRFENGIVVTLGPNNQVIWNGSVVTDGENIVAVGDAAEMKKRFPNAEAVDCTGKIVLPGFICAHHHFYSTMARGMAIPGEPASNFVEILERLWWKVDRALLRRGHHSLGANPADRMHPQRHDHGHRSPCLSRHARWLARSDRKGCPPGRHPRLAVL